MPTTSTPAVTPSWRSRPWTLARITLLAALLVPVIALPAFLGLQIIVVPEVAPFLGLFLALAIANVWTTNRWVQLASGIVAFAFAAMNFAFIYGELVRPDHYPTFFLGWIVVLGGVAGLASGIAGSVDAKRHRFGSPRWAGIGATLLLLGAGFAGGILLSNVASRVVDTGRDATVQLTPDAVVEVDVRAFAFGDGTVTIASGEVTRIALTNFDLEMHTFTIDALGIDAEVLAGKSTDVWVNVATPGTYEIYCKPHSSASGETREGMTGRLVVT